MRDENVRMGKRITTAREARGWSKADLARRASVTPSYITRIEQGAFDRPSIDLVSGIARALNVGVSDLMGTATEPAEVASLRAALIAKGYRPEEAPVLDRLVTRMLEYSPRQRRQLLDLMDRMVELPSDN